MSLLDTKGDRDRGAEPATETKTRYEEDRYTWVEEQVALLRAGRVGELDAHNIAEELSDVGSNEYDKLESALSVVLLHLLNWDYQPERRSRSWVSSIREHRRRTERQLRKNPGLKSRMGEAVEEAYEYARLRCGVETSIEQAALPWSCPYEWEDIMNRKISLDDDV